MIDCSKTFIVIVMMAIITYLTRIFGIVVVKHIPTDGKLKNFLYCIPGAIIISLIAPEIFKGSVEIKIAAFAVLIIAIKTRNILISLIFGIIFLYVIRNFV